MTIAAILRVGRSLPAHLDAAELAVSHHCLMFSTEINDTSRNSLLKYLVDLQRLGATKLTVAMISNGGNVNAGVAMYNLLRSMPFEVEMHNVGNINSVANVVFIGANKRYANPSLTFMFHGIAIDGVTGERWDEKLIMERLESVRIDTERCAKVISDNSNLHLSEAVDMFRQSKTDTAEWAMKVGLVHRLQDFTVPPGADLKHLV